MKNQTYEIDFLPKYVRVLFLLFYIVKTSHNCGYQNLTCITSMANIIFKLFYKLNWIKIRLWN